MLAGGGGLKSARIDLLCTGLPLLSPQARAALGTPDAFACSSVTTGGGGAAIALTGGAGQPRGALNAVFEYLRAPWASF